MEKAQLIMIVKKVILILTIIALSSCMDSNKTKAKPTEVVESMENLNPKEFKNWSITLRADNLAIFNFDDKSTEFGFLSKMEDDRYSFKIKSTNNEKPFIQFSKLPDGIFSSQHTNKKILEITTAFFRSGANNLVYLPNFDGILIEKKGIKLLYLLSDKYRNKLPNDYKAIGDNLYQLE